MQTFTTFTSMKIANKQERTVIHLEKDGHHYYYGNLKALSDHWSEEAIGASYSKLRNYGLSSNKVFYGKNCIIRKGILVTSPHKTDNTSIK